MIVLDATVAIKILTREPDADAALARIVAETERIAPDWIRIEVASALARKVRQDGLPGSAARAARDALPRVVTHEAAALDLIEPAFDLSLELHHPVYDCLYLALALREETALVTHDKRFAATAVRAGYGHAVELLVSE